MNTFITDTFNHCFFKSHQNCKSRSIYLQNSSARPSIICPKLISNRQYKEHFVLRLNGINLGDVNTYSVVGGGGGKRHRGTSLEHPSAQTLE